MITKRTVQMGHEPVEHTGFSDQPMPKLFSLRGPHEHDETDVHVCKLCSAVYVPDESDVCAAKVLTWMETR